jgi:lipopolysaccharide biosynthesis regulator YciM
MFSEILIALIALLLGFVLGRLGGGGEGRRLGRGRRRTDEGLAYIKGVNYILSDAPDLAIEEFIKAVQINSETVETYLALGSLFRSKGDATRAIRIHQGIICRPQVDPKILVQALYELGLDYKKAGLMDRAIATFQDVVAKDPKMIQAFLQLEELYEEVQDWEAAFQAQERLSKLRKTDDRHVLAHLMTELGKGQLVQGDSKGAKGSFKKAIAIDSRCVDAYLHFGDLYAQEGQDGKAVNLWKKVMEVNPSLTFLAYDRLEHAFYRMGHVSALEEFLRESGSQSERDLFTRIFLARHLRKKGEDEEAIRILQSVLERGPHSREARQELIQIYQDRGMIQEAMQQCSQLVDSLAVVDRHFQCRMCGFGSNKLLWKCPQCGRWDTVGSAEEPARDVGKEG